MSAYYTCVAWHDEETDREVRLNNEPRPAWLDIACPGCGEVHFAKSDELLECEFCGASHWIPLTYITSFIEPTT